MAHPLPGKSEEQFQVSFSVSPEKMLSIKNKTMCFGCCSRCSNVGRYFSKAVRFFGRDLNTCFIEARSQQLVAGFIQS